MTKRHHVLETHDNGRSCQADPGRCPICDGGLAYCKVCRKGEGEGELADECPGSPAQPSAQTTSETTVVNLNRDAYDVYIGRAGKGHDGYFGNPFPINATCSRTQAIRRYQRYFHDRISTEPEFKRRVLALRGKRLGCFCRPYPCHGDVIVEWLKTYDLSHKPTMILCGACNKSRVVREDDPITSCPHCGAALV